MPDSRKIRSNALLIIFVIVIFAFAIWLFMKNLNSEVAPVESPNTTTTLTPTSPSPSPAPSSPQDDNPATPKDQKIQGMSWYLEAPPESRKEIDELQKFLDDENAQIEALSKAQQMLKNGDDFQAVAAIGALAWIGGHKSMSTLANVIRERRGDVTDYASEVLQSLFQAQVMNDDVQFDTAVWRDVVEDINEDSERESYFVLLTSNPVETAAPVLIQLWQESKDDEITALSKEYLESLAEGRELPNPSAAEKWFEEYKAKKQKEEDELKQEEEGIVTEDINI